MGEVVDSAMDFALGPFETGMDSLGLSRHGRDMAHQESMAREQMAWQSSENQKNRDFSQQMYEQQLQDYLKNYPELLKQQADSQFGVWSKQFAAENAFNNPAAQLARLRAAGQNPIGSDGLTAGVNSMSGGSSVAPPPQIHGSPLGGSASPVGIPQGMNAELMSQFGQFMRDVSQAGVSRKTIEKLDADIQKELSEKDLVDSQRSYQEMKNGLYQVFGYRKETYELLKLWQEAFRLKAAGNLDAATEKLQEANKRLVNSEAQRNEDLLPILIEQNQQQIEVLKSEKRRNLAEADEALSRKELNKANKELADIAIKVKNAENTPDILAQKSRTVLAKLERDESISKKDAEEARRRIEKLEGIKRTRENAGFVSRAVDDFFSWWTDHISTAVTGGVNASVNNSNSSVKYE